MGALIVVNGAGVISHITGERAASLVVSGSGLSRELCQHQSLTSPVGDGVFWIFDAFLRNVCTTP